MSRSWQRMVERNTKQVNKQRKKQGKETLYANSKSSGKTKDSELFKGRNIVLPVVLVGLGLLYWYIGMMDPVKGNAFVQWLGIALYFILAALIYFRRPFLRVEKTQLSTIKFNRERWLKASEIEKITLSRSAVIIKHKGSRSKWVFSRGKNRFDTEAMGVRLEQFAKANNVQVDHR